MPRRTLAVSSLLLLVGMTLCTAAAWAHSESDGFSSDYREDLDRVADKLTQLAGAIPADKYDWRPAEGIRSVSESVMHVVTAGLFLSSALGVERPEDMKAPPEMEKITDKAAVQKWLTRSIEHMQKAADTAAAGNMDEELEVFGRKFTRRGVLLLITGHMHEHLGQLIAYARSVGVAPPWSQSQG